MDGMGAIAGRETIFAVVQQPGGSAHVPNEGLIIIWSRWFSFTFLAAFVFPWEQRADAEPGAVHVINSDPAPQ